jgi:hypothetical protein
LKISIADCRAGVVVLGMSLADFLVQKRIDAAAFRQAEPERWREWEEIFESVSPASFVAQKLYLINPVRRKYPLAAAEASAAHSAASAKPASAQPVVKPKMT